MATVVLTAVIVALTAFIVLSTVLAGTFSAVHLWSAAGLIVIIVVTAAVGLVVVRHQPRNPIGWLLAGEAIFMLLNIAAGSYAQLVYDQGVHALSFGGLPALILSQTFNLSLTGFPLVILLFPDGRLPSRRWRPVVAAYLAIAVAGVLTVAAAVLQVAIGHHVVLQANGNLASLGQGRTAWAGLVLEVFLLSAGAFWLAAVIRQALSWRRSDGERRQQLKWLASGAAVCGVLGISAVSTNSSIWEVLILGFAALPLGIGIGILTQRRRRPRLRPHRPNRRRPPRPGTRPRLPRANPPRLGRRKQSRPLQRYAHPADCACLGGSAGAGQAGKVVFPPVMKLVRGSLSD
jgi:hypothetical protein